MGEKREVPRLDEVVTASNTYVSTSFVAKLLGVSEARVRKLVAKGVLEHSQWGDKAYMIHLASVEAYRERHKDIARRGPPPGSGGRPPKAKDGGD